ncbi:MAG: hypothetical protein NVSMB53_05780 [Gemmatimonadaceae bacterium]
MSRSIFQSRDFSPEASQLRRFGLLLALARERTSRILPVRAHPTPKPIDVNI